MPPPRLELEPPVMVSPESVAVTPDAIWKTPILPPPLIVTPVVGAVIEVVLLRSIVEFRSIV